MKYLKPRPLTVLPAVLRAQALVPSGMLLAALSLGSCSPIAPSLFKDSSLNSPRAPLAGLAPTPSHSEQSISDEESDDSGSGVWTPSIATGTGYKLVAYTTVIEIGSEDGECSDSSCPLPQDPPLADRHVLTVTFGDALVAQLLQRGEARFAAALDFIPTTVTAKLRLRPELALEDSFADEAHPATARSRAADEPLDWSAVLLHLEPLVVGDASNSHWVVRLPATLTDRQLGELRNRLSAVEIEFEGEADDSDQIQAEGGGTPTLGVQVQPSPSPSLTPAATAPKAVLKPTAPSTAVGASIR